MKRILFTLLVGGALCAFAPASALARGHHRHHRHHHVVRHVRVRRFGEVSGGGSSSTTTPPSSTPAATVTAFDPTSGKLTITLADGTTTETGLVTSDTEMECASTTSVGDDARSDDGPSGGDNGGDNGDNGGGAMCSTANLTPGTAVTGAELQISSDGAVWTKLDLAS